MPAALIAVIGPVDPALLCAWVGHYRRLGIHRFHLGFHFPDHVPDPRRHDLLAACHQLGTGPALVSTGPWHEHTNTELRDTLRAQAGPGWHLLADADEFHQYSTPIARQLAAAEASGRSVVGGLLLDRVSLDGSLTAWTSDTGLDPAYPLGGHLTHHLLGGDPRKIVLARSEIPVASGNHRAPGHKPDPDALACVHHFKWRPEVLDDLRRRVEKFACRAWEEHTPAVRAEATRLLDHVAGHNGRIDIADPRLGFRRVTLEQPMVGWAAEARRITADWRPPAPNSHEAAGTWQNPHSTQQHEGTNA